MEGSTIPRDLWLHLIAPQLGVQELCALMQLSRTSCVVWSDDRVWQHQKQRVCARLPQLEALFDAHAEEPSNKTRKTDWCLPKRGTWFVFNRFLSLGCNMEGFKALCQFASLNQDAKPLVYEIVKAHLPPWAVANTEHWRIYQHNGAGYKCVMFSISADVWGRSTISLTVLRHSNVVRMSFGGNSTTELYDLDAFTEPNWFFDAWLYFLLDLPFEPYWSEKFAALN